MNKLEEYRDKWAKFHRNNLPASFQHYNFEDGKEQGFIMGFDAAIALDLPVKFAQWAGENYFFAQNVGEEGGWITDKELIAEGDYDKRVAMRRPTKQLYKYWIDNIYKS